MKTKNYLRILLLAFGIFVSTAGQAQYNTAIGLRAGESSGVTIKHFINDGAALDFLISAWPNDLAIFGLYEKHQPIGNANGFNFYYGAGAHVAFNTYRRAYYYDRYHDYWWYHNRGGFGIGIDGIIGIEYKFPGIPLALSLDIKPYLEFNTDHNIYFSPDPGLGIKVAF